MPLFLACLFVLFVGGLAWSAIARGKDRREAATRMRSLWGKAHQRFFGGLDPTLYHNLKAEHDESRDIDDQSWEDLYLTDVFRAVDHTRSRVGSQTLYDLLRSPSLDAQEIARRNRLIELFTADAELRESTQAALDLLENDDAGQLANLFYHEMPPRPAEYFIYPLLALGSLAGTVTVALHPFFWPFLLPLLSINLGVAAKYRKKIQQWVQPLRVLNLLVDVGQQFARLSEGKSSEDLKNIVAPIRENRESLRAMDVSTRWLLLERNASMGMMGTIIEYLNMFLLLDVNSFLFTIEAVRHQQKLIQTLFETIGILDAMIAVASYRHNLPYYCVPTFTESGKRLQIEGALHPLLPGGVANSLTADGRSILVTGSNMSGKTTFIRTVAVNTVLAQTISTCIAHRYEATIFHVQTSIGRTDSLSEGKSYYMAEVESIGGFLTDGAGSTPYLFVIDEIFRGTNTTERVAASKAVLDALNRSDGPHIVLVSTHDIELSFLLQTVWDRFHFQEAVVDGELAFDYKIRTGLCSSRNALRLLAARDYPAAVVADAEATAAQIDIVKE